MTALDNAFHNLHQNGLLVLANVADAGGARLAGRERMIGALEKELGVQLIDRSKRPLQLTAAGDVFYRGCWIWRRRQVWSHTPPSLLM